MAGIELFEKLTLPEVARWLEIHPFEVARALGHAGELPARMRFEESVVGRLREICGIELWWDGGQLPVVDPDRPRAVIRSLASRVLSKGLCGGPAHRADNLTRGLEPPDARIAREVVNRFIQDELALSQASHRGLVLRFPATSAAALREIADGVLPASLEALCRQ